MGGQFLILIKRLSLEHIDRLILRKLIQYIKIIENV